MNNILEEYDLNKENYSILVKQLEQLVISLLKNNEVNFHRVKGRVKTKNSLEGKIERKNNKYKNISDITDVIGIRIITYTEDVIDKISEILDGEFIVDRDNSIDKRIKKPNEFGYSSLHKIVQMKDERTNLKEYCKLNGLRFEIQIRSILQHAWAEIEHDIGYKNSSGIPEHLQRDFSRIASLLELADLEFVKLLNNTIEYKNSLEEISTTNELHNFKIDSISLNNYLENEVVVKIDNLIANELNLAFFNDYSKDYSSTIERLAYFDINNLEELDNKIKENEELIVYIAKEFARDSDKTKQVRNVSRGITLFYLSYALLKSKDISDIITYLKEFKIGEIDTYSIIAERLKGFLDSFDKTE